MKLIAITLLALLLVLSIISKEAVKISFYNGVYDSCMVLMSKFANGYDDKEYDQAVAYCDRLVTNAKEIDAFHNRVELKPKDTIDG